MEAQLVHDTSVAREGEREIWTETIVNALLRLE